MPLITSCSPMLSLIHEFGNIGICDQSPTGLFYCVLYASKGLQNSLCSVDYKSRVYCFDYVRSRGFEYVVVDSLVNTRPPEYAIV